LGQGTNGAEAKRCGYFGQKSIMGVREIRTKGHKRAKKGRMGEKDAKNRKKMKKSVDKRVMVWYSN
jgi:hypothetical protein